MKRIFLDDPEIDLEEENLEFRLTYEGPLRATQRDPINNQLDGRADHKHEIRMEFHKQLKALWEVTPFLRDGIISGPRLTGNDAMGNPAFIHFPRFDKDTIIKTYKRQGFDFLPLVTPESALLCGLEILFLRPDISPGNVPWSGDIDNRLKTLFDALRMPEPNEKYENRQPKADEVPFYCLMSDDKLISKISVETDRLLQPVNGKNDDVRLVVTVKLRPYELNFGNIGFG